MNVIPVDLTAKPSLSNPEDWNDDWDDDDEEVEEKESNTSTESNPSTESKSALFGKSSKRLAHTPKNSAKKPDKGMKKVLYSHQCNKVVSFDMTSLKTWISSICLCNFVSLQCWFLFVQEHVILL